MLGFPLRWISFSSDRWAPVWAFQGDLWFYEDGPNVIGPDVVFSFIFFSSVVYYVAFRSNAYPETETGKIFGGLIFILAATTAVFAALRSVGMFLVPLRIQTFLPCILIFFSSFSFFLFFFFFFSSAPPSPSTMTKEWKQAEDVYVRKQNANPISGISSEGYKGKGMSGSLNFS